MARRCMTVARFSKRIPESKVGAVRIIHNWNLMLLEHGLDITYAIWTLRHMATSWLRITANITTRVTETVYRPKSDEDSRTRRFCSPLKP